MLLFQFAHPCIHQHICEARSCAHNHHGHAKAHRICRKAQHKKAQGKRNAGKLQPARAQHRVEPRRHNHRGDQPKRIAQQQEAKSRIADIQTCFNLRHIGRKTPPKQANNNKCDRRATRQVEGVKNVHRLFFHSPWPLARNKAIKGFSFVPYGPIRRTSSGHTPLEDAPPF